MINAMDERHTIPVPTIDRLAAAYLFIVGRHQQAEPVINTWLDQLKIAKIDQLWIEAKDSLKIEDVRLLQRDLLLAPVGGMRRVAVIPRAESLSLEASNAMLKLLEDPPPHAVIVLVSPSEDLLLGTIVSRCQRWRLLPDGESSSARTVEDWSIRTLRQQTYAERIAQAERWAKREDFADVFDDLLAAARKAMLDGELSTAGMEQLLRLRCLVATNVAARLLAEVSLLSFGKASG